MLRTVGPSTPAGRPPTCRLHCLLSAAVDGKRSWPAAACTAETGLELLHRSFYRTALYQGARVLQRAATVPCLRCQSVGSAGQGRGDESKRSRRPRWHPKSTKSKACMACHLGIWANVSGENIGTLFHSSRVEKFHAERNKLKVVSVAVLCSKFYTGRLGCLEHRNKKHKNRKKMQE